MAGMSIHSLLLRAMLCLGLILNGSGHALAIAPMQAAHAAGHAAEAPAAGVPAMDDAAVISDSTVMADMPCHRHKAPVAGKPAEMPARESLPAEPLPSDELSDHADCCDSAAACGCACMQGHAGAPASACCDAVAMHVRSVRPMHLGYASPTLPHLIRPPIG